MRFSRGNNQLAMTGLVVYGALLVAALVYYFRNELSGYWTEEAQHTEMSAAELQRQHTGTIMIPEGIIGRCRRLKFDNVSGTMMDAGTGPCRDDAPTNTPGELRVNSIRDSFVKR
jgi:hypothetical protein